MVDQLKQALADQYGSVEDDAVVKITGSADKSLELIRQFRNEVNPKIAMTVDLLTTGIDVPPIALSRENSVTKRAGMKRSCRIYPASHLPV